MDESQLRKKMRERYLMSEMRMNALYDSQNASASPTRLSPPRSNSINGVTYQTINNKLHEGGGGGRKRR
jgi:hypothetical protein